MSTGQTPYHGLSTWTDTQEFLDTRHSVYDSPTMRQTLEQDRAMFDRRMQKKLVDVYAERSKLAECQRIWSEVSRESGFSEAELLSITNFPQEICDASAIAVWRMYQAKASQRTISKVIGRKPCSISQMAAKGRILDAARTVQP